MGQRIEPTIEGERAGLRGKGEKEGLTKRGREGGKGGRKGSEGGRVGSVLERGKEGGREEGREGRLPLGGGGSK